MSVFSEDVKQLEHFFRCGCQRYYSSSDNYCHYEQCSAFFMHPPSVAWMPMLPMPFILGGSIAFQKLLAPPYADVRQKVGLLNVRLSNDLSSITTIKSFTDKDYETVRLEAGSNGCYRINTKLIALHGAFIPLIRILILAAFTVLLILG
jgi:ATP-binding cassette subfamily B protein